MENTTLTSNSLTTDKSFNGTIWRPLNSDLNDELVFEVAQKNNISINLSKLLINRKISKIPNFLNSKLKDNICLLYTSPSPRDTVTSRMPSSA